MEELQHRRKHWFFRYKIYHIPFWFLYNYLWWAIQSRNLVQTASNAFFSVYTLKFSFYVVFQAAAAYFNLYYLIPVFLEKGKYLIYVLLLLLTVLCAASLIVPGYFLTVWVSGRSFDDLFGKGSHTFFDLLIWSPLPTTAASTTLAMSIKLAKNWIQTQRRERMLEKEKLETELKFLKYQFNPHFLFNSINSIFFLIHKNPDMASDALAKFSDLLRHQLYESNDRQISLDKEITYLENFVELEKLRQSSKLQVSFHISEPFYGHLEIAPFILMTFVENAFKHVSKDDDHPNRVNIQLESRQDQLCFKVANSTSNSASKDVVNYGGIGLQNVKRRLDLIYPEQHRLQIQSGVDSFTVELWINLTGKTVMPEIQSKTIESYTTVSAVS